MSENFSCLDEMIHSGEEEIVLDCDILLDNTEEMKYLEGIELDVDDIVIDGNGFTVDARGRTRIFLCTGENVVIRNIVFKNGFARESGGAIMLEEGELAIEDVSFSFNSCGEDGGALHNDEGSLVVRKCEFLDNNAGDFGGAINNWGDLALIESVFKDNKANYGGAIFNTGDLMVNDSVFSSNNANRGAAIYNEDGDLNIIKSSFNDNAAGECGGAIINRNCDMIISKSGFNANRANDGGAVHTTGEVRVIESSFRDNEALNDGGAVFAGRADITVKDCEFSGNAAGSNGGSLYGFDGEASVLKSFFKANNASFGGAISNVKNVMDISDSEFIGNSAIESGGAIYLEKSDCESSNLSFSDNKPDDVFEK